MWAWHWVRAISPLTARPHSSPHSDFAFSMAALQRSWRCCGVISAKASWPLPWNRGRARRRFCGLVFALPAEGALAGFQGLGLSDVAGAGGDVGTERCGQAQYEQDRQPTHITIIIGIIIGVELEQKLPKCRNPSSSSRAIGLRHELLTRLLSSGSPQLSCSL